MSPPFRWGHFTFSRSAILCPTQAFSLSLLAESKACCVGRLSAVHVSLPPRPLPLFTRLKAKTGRSPTPARRGAQGALGYAEAPTAALPPPAGLRPCLICAWLGRGSRGGKRAFRSACFKPPCMPRLCNSKARHGAASET